MKVVVFITQTQDTEAKIKVGASGDCIDSEGIKWIMNPYDEFAVEEAIQTAEKHGGEVVIVSAGPARVVEAIRQGLAMGAASAVHIKDEALAEADPYTVAKVAAFGIRKAGDFDLIFTGMKVIDEESAQVGIQIAEELGIPHAALVSKVVEIKPDEKKMVCQKEVDGGTATVEIPLPALVTCPDAMNEPRYASLPGIMKAKKKPVLEISLDEIDFDSLGIPRESVGKTGARVKTVKVEVPRIERRLKIIKGSDDTTVKNDEIAKSAGEIVKLLRDEAKVI